MAAAAGSRRRPGVICFVTTDFVGAGLDREVGTGLRLLSSLLARRDWEVHVLFCGTGEDEGVGPPAAALARVGVVLHLLDELPPSPGAGRPHYGGDDPALIRGEHALEALEALHAEQRFDLIEFPDWRAPGFRAVQAKVAGDALLDTSLAVRLQGATQWRRQINLEQRSAPRDLKIEFCERYAFERSDVQLGSSRYLLDCARQVDWAVRDDAVVACPYPEPEPGEAVQSGEIRELVYLGRLERCNGLDLFLEALDSVAPDMPVLFLGSDPPVEGRLAREMIADRLGGRPHRIETEPDREGTLAELRHGDRLVVIPSPNEAFGFLVANCVANCVPFLAARAEGVPEVVDHPEGRKRWLFDPTPGGLRGTLTRRLSASNAEEAELRAEVAAACDSGRWNDRVEAVYREFASRPISQTTVRSSEPATVTVAVAHHNHDRFLPGALASLAAQTRPPDEVIVVDDGSTSETARRVFSEQEARYPDWTFVRQENTGPGPARDRCLERAAGAYFLPFDSDNVATPRLIERLLRAMERNPSRAATTCHHLAFVEDAEIEAGEFAFRYSPTGGPRLLACVENVYGDTCALFRTESLRSVGGFEGHPWSPDEDWETFAKMALDGLEIEVLPQPLFYYRIVQGGRLQTLGEDPALAYRQRTHLVDFFVNAELTARERRDLWECLQAFDRFTTVGVNARLEEQRLWHDSQIADHNVYRLAQLEQLRAQLGAEVGAQRRRAEAAEGELASVAASTPRRLVPRALRSVRSRVLGSSKPAP